MIKTSFFRISSEHFQVLKQIKATGVDFYISGSFILSVLNIIHRPINDLDIIVKNRSGFKLLYETFGGELFDVYEKVDGENAIETVLNANQIGTTINGIHVCIFCNDEETFEMELDGEKYNLAYPYSIIKAKFKYVWNIVLNTELNDSQKKRLTKHLSDIEDYTIFEATKKID